MPNIAPVRIAITVFILIAIGVVIKLLLPTPLTKQRWAVYYSSAVPIPPDLLSGWDLLVLDADGHPPLNLITDKKTVKLAYLSIGEVADYRYDFNDFKNAGVLIALKKGQQHVYVTDVRKDTFYPLIKKRIEAAKMQGFNGIMLDTLDTTIALGRSDEIGFALDGKPTVYPDMNAAAIKLVQQIHTDFPDMKIMVNRGFDIIPAIASSINMVIAESTLTDGHHYYTGNDLASYEGTRAILAATHIPVYALDYWDMSDASGVEALYEAQRRQGLCPYVSDPSLQKLYREP